MRQKLSFGVMGISRDCLFLGTFNPPHQGHVVMAQAVLTQGGFDRVVWIPAGTPPHRLGELDMASFSDRLAMVRLICDEYSGFEACGVEGEREGPTYTVDTLKALYPQASVEHPIDVLIGADALAGLALWKDPLWLARHVRFWQAPRTGTPCTSHVQVGQTVNSLNTKILDMAPVNVSATQVRRALQSDEPCEEGVLPPSVLAYAKTHQLYAPCGSSHISS